MIDQFTERSDRGPIVTVAPSTGWSTWTPEEPEAEEQHHPVSQWLDREERDLRRLPVAQWTSVCTMGMIEYGYWAPMHNDHFLSCGVGASECDQGFTALAIWSDTGRFAGFGPFIYGSAHQAARGCQAHFEHGDGVSLSSVEAGY